MVRSRCVHGVHCILYSRIHLTDFMFLLYIAQSRQSARLFLQTSELGLPCLLNRRRVCPPPSFGLGGETHSPAGEGSLYGVDVTAEIDLTESKNQHKVTLTSQSDFKSY
jgi:hypothetical protein